MARKLQHVADRDDVEFAEREGRKVRMLCGAKHYPMRGMDDSIPTCTPCSRKALQLTSSGVYVWKNQ